MEDERDTIKKVESLMWMKCNCNCIFCSLGDKLDLARKEKNYGLKTTKDIMEDIDYAASINATTFSFSGGEPSIRPDLPFLISYAKRKGTENIQVQSNGRMFHYKEYCKLLIDAGATEFAISFHSPSEETQDKLMGVKGSYRQALSGIKNLIKMGQVVKVTIVITAFNYKDLPALTEMLLKLGVCEIRYDFATIEGYVKKNPERIVPEMGKVIPYLRKCFKIDNPKKAGMPVYNIPHCLLPEHADHVVDMTQPGTQLRGSDFVISIKDNREKDRTKPRECRLCIYDRACTGVWKSYAKIHGLKEISPIKRNK